MVLLPFVMSMGAIVNVCERCPLLYGRVRFKVAEGQVPRIEAHCTSLIEYSRYASQK